MARAFLDFRGFSRFGRARVKLWVNHRYDVTNGRRWRTSGDRFGPKILAFPGIPWDSCIARSPVGTRPLRCDRWLQTPWGRLRLSTDGPIGKER
jgi:hypothetical protein